MHTTHWSYVDIQRTGAQSWVTKHRDEELIQEDRSPDLVLVRQLWQSHHKEDGENQATVYWWVEEALEYANQGMEMTTETCIWGKVHIQSTWMGGKSSAMETLAGMTVDCGRRFED
jgi:hypothetical protein